MTNTEEQKTETDNLTNETEATTTEDVVETPTEEVAETELSAEEKLQAEAAELKDKYLRLYADFENFRRRSAAEKIELRKNASEDVLKDLLVIMDDFERIPETEVSEGITLVFNKFKNTLTSKGLKPMDAQNQTFDVDLHECITQFPAPTDEQKGKVIDVLEKGYYLNDKVIRFAKVVVGS
jgi:molecular chaperone GrpE